MGLSEDIFKLKNNNIWRQLQIWIANMNVLRQENFIIFYHIAKNFKKIQESK